MKFRWNEVTWYSKVCSLVVFVGLMPAMIWYVGAQCRLTVKSQEDMQASLSAALSQPVRAVRPVHQLRPVHLATSTPSTTCDPSAGGDCGQEQSQR